MSRYRGYGRLALMVATVLCALAGCASVGREAAVGVPGEQRLTSVGGAVAAPEGWPEAVPLPEGVPIDGVRCSNRYCTLWFGLMDYNQMVALRRNYTGLLRNSGKWEQLGSPSGPYEHEAFRYTGATPSGCGYTLEIRSPVANDAYNRFRVSTSLTW